MTPYCPTVHLHVVDEDRCLRALVPGRNEREGIAFLENIGAGVSGSGLRMTQLGSSIPTIRREYESRLQRLIQEMETRRKTLSSAELAQWLSESRTNIARTMR